MPATVIKMGSKPPRTRRQRGSGEAQDGGDKGAPWAPPPPPPPEGYPVPTSTPTSERPAAGTAAAAATVPQTSVTATRPRPQGPPPLNNQATDPGSPLSRELLIIKPIRMTDPEAHEQRLAEEACVKTTLADFSRAAGLCSRQVQTSPETTMPKEWAQTTGADLLTTADATTEGSAALQWDAWGRLYQIAAKAIDALGIDPRIRDAPPPQAMSRTAMSALLDAEEGWLAPATSPVDQIAQAAGTLPNTQPAHAALRLFAELKGITDICFTARFLMAKLAIIDTERARPGTVIAAVAAVTDVLDSPDQQDLADREAPIAIQPGRGVRYSRHKHVLARTRAEAVEATSDERIEVNEAINLPARLLPYGCMHTEGAVRALEDKRVDTIAMAAALTQPCHLEPVPIPWTPALGTIDASRFKDSETGNEPPVQGVLETVERIAILKAGTVPNTSAPEPRIREHFQRIRHTVHEALSSWHDKSPPPALGGASIAPSIRTIFPAPQEPVSDDPARYEQPWARDNTATAIAGAEMRLTLAGLGHFLSADIHDAIAEPTNYFPIGKPESQEQMHRVQLWRRNYIRTCNDPRQARMQAQFYTMRAQQAAASLPSSLAEFAVAALLQCAVAWGMTEHDILADLGYLHPLRGLRKVARRAAWGIPLPDPEGWAAADWDHTRSPPAPPPRAAEADQPAPTTRRNDQTPARTVQNGFWQITPAGAPSLFASHFKSEIRDQIRPVMSVVGVDMANAYEDAFQSFTQRRARQEPKSAPSAESEWVRFAIRSRRIPAAQWNLRTRLDNAQTPQEQVERLDWVAQDTTRLAADLADDADTATPEFAPEETLALPFHIEEGGEGDPDHTNSEQSTTGAMTAEARRRSMQRSLLVGPRPADPRAERTEMQLQRWERVLRHRVHQTAELLRRADNLPRSRSVTIAHHETVSAAIRLGTAQAQVDRLATMSAHQQHLTHSGREQTNPPKTQEPSTTEDGHRNPRALGDTKHPAGDDLHAPPGQAAPEDQPGTREHGAGSGGPRRSRRRGITRSFIEIAGDDGYRHADWPMAPPPAQQFQGHRTSYSFGNVLPPWTNTMSSCRVTRRPQRAVFPAADALSDTETLGDDERRPRDPWWAEAGYGRKIRDGPDPAK